MYIKWAKEILYEISIYGRKTSVHGPFKDIRLYMILFQAFLKQPRFHNVIERDVTDIHFRDIGDRWSNFDFEGGTLSYLMG